MEPEEFEAKYEEGTGDEFPDDGGEELLMRQDIIDGITLLTKIRTMLDYIGNAELCRTVTKRERETMAKVSHQVTNYLDSVISNYPEAEEE